MSVNPRLKRFDLIVISLMGMSIFLSPAFVASKSGDPWIFFDAWIFGGLVTLCGTLTFAEIGARYLVQAAFTKFTPNRYHQAFTFIINGRW